MSAEERAKRITVLLTERGTEAIGRACHRTGHNTADAVNQAVHIYDLMVEAASRSGPTTFTAPLGNHVLYVVASPTPLPRAKRKWFPW